MKVLFAVSNENTSQAIIKKYQSEYKQILSYKNVYYFNAILKELQRDKTYDRVVISEDLEQYVNTDYEQMDKFLFDRLDSISDEASNVDGEDIPIILICTERRNKSEPILVKLFGIGIYNAILGNDRSASEVCRLINRPRSKKEAKIYYKIDSEEVSYEKTDENDVSELEIQNILAHYKRIQNDEERYVESFDNIANQYNDAQLRVISKCLPLNVRAVLEEKSPKYQQINSYNNKVSDKIRVEKKKQQPGTSEILLKNSQTKKPTAPVVIPESIDASKKKKILIKPSQATEAMQRPVQRIVPENNTQKSIHELAERENEENNDLLKDIEIDDIPEEEYMPETNIEDIESENKEPIVEEAVQPVKRGRGRPRKVVAEPVAEQPKRKRGRPRKNVETAEDQEETLPGFEDEEETVLPGFENEQEDNDETVLPGFEEDELEEESLPGVYEEEQALPGVEASESIKSSVNIPNVQRQNMDTQYTNVLNNLREENQKTENIEHDVLKREKIEYPELDMNNLVNPDQKIVAFVGTSKNGTSFLINNVAEILSMNGIDTAILDLTQNRNAYYIYTKNEDELREQSTYIMNNLKVGRANGIQEHKNLTIYTSPFEGDENLQAVEPIVETLVKSHKVVLMDCDFLTPMRYFKYAQEIYLVQSMDILTIQPLTAFLRQLSDKEMLEESKVRVVLNKFIRTKEINEELLIGGISIYNDAGMTVRKELFNRKTVKRIMIPFDLKSYLRYLDGMVTCDVSLKGYNKEFLQSLKNLASMVYPVGKNQAKYMPPSVKNNNNNSFSPKMNNTLNQMKQNY
mgnify:FL=1